MPRSLFSRVDEVNIPRFFGNGQHTHTGSGSDPAPPHWWTELTLVEKYLVLDSETNRVRITAAPRQ